MAGIALVLASPLFLLCALAIKLEGLIDPRARGPVFLKELRVSRGDVFELLKFRVLTRSALAELDDGPTYIARLEQAGRLTRVGRVLKQWYLDELPQLVNIVKGEMFLIGTRPWPIVKYEAQLAQGITLKRDMPAGLVGLVQANKGNFVEKDPIELDTYYWEAFKTYSAWRLLMLDLRILARSGKVQLEHRGI